MEKLITILSCIIVGQLAQSKEIISAFGKTAQTEFNGWSVSPYNAFDDVKFSENGIEIYSANGGDYTLSFQSKIISLKDYTSVQLNLAFNSLQNAHLNFVDIAVSNDGKVWKNLNVNQKELTAEFENTDLQTQYLKISANLSLNSNAIFQFTDLELSGEKKKTELEEQLREIKEEKPFFVFCFNRSITVETKLESSYTIVITNLAGQNVFSFETAESTRIEPDLNDGIYIVSIIQNEQLIFNKKIIF